MPLLRQMMYLSPFCDDIEPDIFRTGNNPLLAMFEVYPPTIDATVDSNGRIQNIDFLLDRGYTVQDVSGDGRTCLHMFFDFIFGPWSEGEWGEWVEVLTHLMKRGANPYSVDCYGRTVSNTAYHSGICYWCEERCGSYTGDLCDAALDICSFQISDFRRQWPRRAAYTWLYTRDHFEILWKGREHRCPYWNDEVWPRIIFDYEADSTRRLEAELCYRKKFGDGTSTSDGSLSSDKDAPDEKASPDLESRTSEGENLQTRRRLCSECRDRLEERYWDDVDANSSVQSPEHDENEGDSHRDWLCDSKASHLH